MSEAVPPTRADLLRRIGEAGPAPWHPPRGDDLFDPLNDLRLAGLVEMTDWEAGRGQGYVLTQLGREVVADPNYMAAVNQLDAPGRRPWGTDRELDRRAEDGPATAWDRGEHVRSVLMTPIRPIVTPILIAACIIFFFVGLALAVRNQVNVRQYLIRGDVAVMHKTGALTGKDLANAEWGRMVFCGFVHWGLLHLFVNMISLFMIGPFAEQLWGRGRFVALYLLSAFGASFLAVMVNPASMFAGASGANLGVLASIGVGMWLNRSHLPAELVRRLMTQLGFVFVLSVVISLFPGVSWSGHLGGAAAGGLVGLLLNMHRFGAPNKRLVAVVLMASLPFAGAGVLTWSMKNDPNWNAAQARRRVADRKAFLAEQEPAVEAAFDDFNKLKDVLFIPAKAAEARGLAADLQRRATDRVTGLIEGEFDEDDEAYVAASEFWRDVQTYAGLATDRLDGKLEEKQPLRDAADAVRKAEGRFGRAAG